MFDLINIVRQNDERLDIAGGNKCQRTRRSTLLLFGLPYLVVELCSPLQNNMSFLWPLLDLGVEP